MTERPRAMRRLRLVNEVYHCKHSSYSNQKLVNTGQEPTICAVIKNLKEMNNNPQQAVIAVQEERARIGGIQVAKKTVIAATDEGLVCLTHQISVALIVYSVITENICNPGLQREIVITDICYPSE